MKCIFCKEDIIDNSPYCPYCGEAQPHEVQTDNESKDITEVVSEELVKTIIETSKEVTSSGINQGPSLTIASDGTEDGELLHTNDNEDSADSLIEQTHTDDNLDSEELPAPEDSTETSEQELLEESSPQIVAKEKFKFSFHKNKQEPEETPIVNADGYYTEIFPTKNEKFPVSRGEFIAKFILLGLLLISIALFMIYVIQ